ncbi:response regulator transcription factor [Streptomyces sp. NBC_01707]|jgi:two-component system response regulator NreC|uniref:response regulator n=1 Tax=unclassified Streptomyces TaxID=2593676 RepID=UPI00087FBD9F|nr:MULTISPECIES: response regulator transcription factor [unclassified Streptomyces]MDX3771044.1 response regulator transcription factor [Streptomyces sp. AK08-01B]MDX3821249.1 response regulator transcription factor [Streptomyces sp. AK08-01A]SCY19767.1 two component transcriptional regulator, LuxR family [Streptomyces sp. 136MFCol5.1]
MDAPSSTPSRQGSPEVTVVLADDHLVVRAGMRLLLAQDQAFRIVAESATVPDTLDAVREHRPRVLVLDLTMAGQSSLPMIPALLTASPGTRILVLTMQEDPAFTREALRTGAAGYLLKEAAAEELLAAAHQVADGATYVQPVLGARLAVETPGPAHQEPLPELGARSAAATPGPADQEPLTVREAEVLSLMALGHTNQEIAQRLYVSVRTVETHRSRIRDKLGKDTRAELIAAARERGLVA